MSKHSLNSFITNLFEWINGFKFGDYPRQFSVKRGEIKPSLYGMCDMVYNLVIPNQLEEYLNSYNDISLEKWINNIQSFQDPKTGWFKEPGFNFGFHFKEHSTAFAVSALKLLGSEPKYNLKIREKLKSKKQVERWLNRVPEWGLLYWPGSHRGGGVASIFATLGKQSYPNEQFFNWYFDWLDKRADPQVGFWRIGWNHKIIKNRLTKQELGGAIHYYWIYEFIGHPIPYPEKVIDSTLKLQNDLGLWDKDVSYCIDLDAVFSLLRCLKQAGGYREEDIKSAIIKYLDYTVPSLNDKKFLFNRYDNTHKLTGCLGAIAEIYKYMPQLFELSIPWIQTLDITPWI